MCKRSKWIHRFCLMAATVMILLLSGEEGQTAAQSFYPQDTDMPVVVDFINGDFEEPELRNTYLPLSWKDSLGTGPTVEAYIAGGGGWLYVPDADVPGWNAKPVDPADDINPFANMIEMQWSSGSKVGYFSEQKIDMLGAMNQEFYQVVPTTPGTNIYYSYYAQRTGFDVQFFCGDENNPELIRTDTMISSWQRFYGRVTVTGNSTYFGYRCPNGTENISTFTYNGITYTNIKSSGGGAHLDNIQFQTQAKLLIKKEVSTIVADEALLGEILTYTITITNHGQTDTSKTVLTDVLGNDVEFVGSVTIDGADAGDFAAFDEATDTLTVMLGNGAAKTTGGSLAGTVSTDSAVGESTVIAFDVKVTGDFGDTIRNQAAVSYDDKDFEDQSGGGYTDYSNVTEVKIVNKACYSIEVNKQLAAPAEANESFVFRVDAYTLDGSTFLRTFYCEVRISKGSQNGAVTIDQFYAGRYQVTELDSNWKYNITDPLLLSQNIRADNPYSPVRVTFINKNTGNGWVGGEGYITNQMKSVS